MTDDPVERQSRPPGAGSGVSDLVPGQFLTRPCVDAFGGSEFALCPTHDVDRVHKTYQSLYYAVVERRRYHLETLFTEDEPYWQFEEIMKLEDEFGVRSTFFFLQEKRLFGEMPPHEWLRPRNWVLRTGGYDIESTSITNVIRALDDGGWEIGLHGSYDSYQDRNRLRREKRVLERLVGHPITGGRQHYLNLEIPDTWRHHVAVGLKYDASLGTSRSYGFDHPVVRPFGSDFLVFPLTVMEATLPDPGTRWSAACDAVGRLLSEGAERNAVMTVLWHPRMFNEEEFPGYRELYRWTLVEAEAREAWIGPLEDAYRELFTGLDERDSLEGQAASPESDVP